MKPELYDDTKISWYWFAGALVIALILVWIMQPGAKQQRQLEQQRSTYARERGEPMRSQIERYRQNTIELAETIEQFKERFGMAQFPPFILPESEKRDPWAYLDRVGASVVSRLGRIATVRGIELVDPDLGLINEYKNIGETPQESLYQVMLTARTIYLAVQVPPSGQPLQSVNVTHAMSQLAGSPERPPLLQEFPLRLTITGGHEEVLWVLHQLSVEEPKLMHGNVQNGWEEFVQDVQMDTGQEGAFDRIGFREHFPMVLRNFELLSENYSENEAVQTVTAHFDIAAMRFLDAADRGEEDTVRTGGRSLGGAPVITRPP